MIKIKKATKADDTILALLGRITYVESHGHFIGDKNDLFEYCNKAFAISKLQQDLSNPDNLFYIIYKEDFPIGYSKLVLNETHESITSQSNCLLERIYILNDFIALKVGQQFLTFVEEIVKKLQLDTMWLSVYIKNHRAIRFYQKNEFNSVGKLNFLVNGVEYENTVFSKKIGR